MTQRVLTLLLVAALASGCRPTFLYGVTPSGPPEYVLGWEDGCDTGISAEGYWMDKLVFGFKKRPELAASDQYKNGWNEGFSYCRFSYASSRGSGDFRDIGLGEGF